MIICEDVSSQCHQAVDSDSACSLGELEAFLDKSALEASGRVNNPQLTTFMRSLLTGACEGGAGEDASVSEEWLRKRSSDKPLQPNILDSTVVQVAGGIGRGGGAAAFTLVAG